MKMKRKIFLLLLLIIGTLTGCFSFGKNFFFRERNISSSVLAQSSSDWPTVAHDNSRSGRTNGLFGSTAIEEKWYRVFNDTEFATRTSAVIANGLVYIGAYTGDFFALNLSNGSTKWQVKLGGPVVNAAAVEGGIVYVPCLDGNLYALDAATGQERWRFRARAGFTTAPCVENGIVYLGSRDGNFYALQNGQERWRYTVGVPIRNTAALKDNTVYFAGEDMRVYALNASNGTLIWRTNRLHGKSFKDYYPVVTDSLVVVRTTPIEKFHDIQENDSLIETAFAFNRTTGQKAFTVPLFYLAGCGGTAAPPVMASDGGLYFIGQSAIFKMAPSGQMSEVGYYDGPSDESYTISASADNGNRLWIAHQDVFGSFDPNSGTSYWQTHCYSNSCCGMRDSSGGHDIVEWSRNAWHGPAQAPPAIAGDRIIWQTGSYIICIGPRG